MARTDLAYFAGIVDGEGSITVERYNGSPSKYPHYSYRLKLRVSNTNFGLIEALVYAFGGNYTKAKKRQGYKECYTWYLTSHPASKCLSLLCPYLMIKKTHAELALQFQLYKTGKGGTGHYKDANDLKIEEEFYWKFRQLNKRGEDV